MRMHRACLSTRQEYRHTFIISNVYCFFKATVVMRTRLSITLNANFLSCYVSGCRTRLFGKCNCPKVIIKDNTNKTHNIIIHNLQLKFYNWKVFRSSSGHVQGVHIYCTGLFISPSGISELDCATTKTDTAERSISIGRESLQVFFVLGASAYFHLPPLGGSREEKWRSQ